MFLYDHVPPASTPVTAPRSVITVPARGATSVGQVATSAASAVSAPASRPAPSKCPVSAGAPPPSSPPHATEANKGVSRSPASERRMCFEYAETGASARDPLRNPYSSRIRDHIPTSPQSFGLFRVG